MKISVSSMKGNKDQIDIKTAWNLEERAAPMHLSDHILTYYLSQSDRLYQCHNEDLEMHPLLC